MKALIISELSFFWWTWRESNPRPNEEIISFLHAYLCLIFEQRQNQSHQPLPYPLKFHSRLKADKNYPRCNCTTGSECFGATASE